MDRQKYHENSDYREGFDDGVKAGRKQITEALKLLKKYMNEFLKGYDNLVERGDADGEIYN